MRVFELDWFNLLRVEEWIRSIELIFFLVDEEVEFIVYLDIEFLVLVVFFFWVRV